MQSRLGKLIELICIDMSEQDNIDLAWAIIEKVGVCMLTTQFAGDEASPSRNAC
jgi:hypothetical protein